MRQGWILNLSVPDRSHRVTLPGPEAVTLSDGSLVFEIWFWHAELHRWFVMTRRKDPGAAAAGVIAFTPEQTQNLPRLLVALGKEAGLL